jgi:hypothetical protein
VLTNLLCTNSFNYEGDSPVAFWYFRLDEREGEVHCACPERRNRNVILLTIDISSVRLPHTIYNKSPKYNECMEIIGGAWRVFYHGYMGRVSEVRAGVTNHEGHFRQVAKGRRTWVNRSGFLVPSADVAGWRHYCLSPTTLFELHSAIASLLHHLS